MPLGLAYSIAIRLAVGIEIIAALLLLVTGVFSMESFETFSRTNRPDVEAIVDISAMREDPIYYWLTITFVSFVVAGLREELWRSACLCGLRSVAPRYFSSTAGQICGSGCGGDLWARSFGTRLAGGRAYRCAWICTGIIMVLHRSICLP